MSMKNNRQETISGMSLTGLFCASLLLALCFGCDEGNEEGANASELGGSPAAGGAGGDPPSPGPEGGTAGTGGAAGSGGAGGTSRGQGDAGVLDPVESDQGPNAPLDQQVEDQLLIEAPDLFVPPPAPDQGGIEDTPPGTGVHAFTVNDIFGRSVDLRVYRGQTLLIINVASACGFTRQYEGLQALYEELEDSSFQILGFPANDFGRQEPGSEEDILEFCSREYGVTFPMFSKVQVVNGPEQAPLFSYLSEREGAPQWNFHKYLINPEGEVVSSYRSAVTPEDPALRAAIEALLPTP